MDDQANIVKVEGKKDENEKEKYEKILLNIEPLNPFFKMGESQKSLLQEECDSLNVMVFKYNDLKILYEIFPRWKGKYFKMKEFITNCNNILGENDNKLKTKAEGKNSGDNDENIDPEIDLLKDPLNTTLRWKLNCCRRPGQVIKVM